MLHGQRVGGWSDRQDIVAPQGQRRDQAALDRALDGWIEKQHRVAEEGMRKAVANPFRREAEDHGAVGEPGARKLGLVDAEEGRQLGSRWL